MALTKTEIPNEILRAFQAGVDDILNENDAVRRRLQAAEVVGVRTFTLGLDEIQRARKPYNLIPAGWRILATDRDGLVVSADVAQSGNQTRVVSISTDPAGGDLAKSLKYVDELAAQMPQALTVSLLRIPGVLVDALVLAGQPGTEDVMVPIRAPDDSFELMRKYTVDEFFSRIASPPVDRLGEPSLLQRFLEFNEVQPR
jgi:hypothetical protein